MTTATATATVPAEGRTDVFRALHVPGDPLMLANAWDVRSALCMQQAGFRAIGTTSSGIADVLGHRDGERAPARAMLSMARSIARSVKVPVNVDLEGGYGRSPQELVAFLARAGAAGCNIEDTDHHNGGLLDVEDQAARIAAMRTEAARRGHHLTITARVDTFIQPDAPSRPAPLLEDAIARGRVYAEAGADCVFPIGMTSVEALRAFLAVMPCPVSVMRSPGAPSPADLAALGVARISHGGQMYHQAVKGTFAYLRGAAKELAASGGD